MLDPENPNTYMPLDSEEIDSESKSRVVTILEQKRLRNRIGSNTLTFNLAGNVSELQRITAKQAMHHRASTPSIVAVPIASLSGL